MKTKQTLNTKSIKDFEILDGMFKGYYISWWKNKKQHITLMRNKDCIYGEELYTTQQKKDLSTKEILLIAQAILKYKKIKGE